MVSLSPIRKKRLETQGYFYSDEQLCDYAPGIRFAYMICGGLVLLGLVFKSLFILSLALAIAFFGTILPRHPVDFLYNSFVHKILKKPVLPTRPRQANFACLIATVLISGIIYSLIKGNMFWMYALGAILLFSSTLVSFLDICIPSIVYNFIFKNHSIKK